MSVADIFAAGLEVAVNRVLRYDVMTQARLAALAGKVIAFDLSGLNIRLYLLPAQDKLQVLARSDLVPDVTLSGTPLAFVRMGAESRTSERLFAGDIGVTGDVEVASRFGNALRGMDIEWEEMAAQVMGDVLAHKLGEGVRTGLRWGQDAAGRLQQDMGEYLQEELRQLPARVEIEDFMRDVDFLRADADRLEARVARLKRTLETPQT